MELENRKREELDYPPDHADLAEPQNVDLACSQDTDMLMASTATAMMRGRSLEMCIYLMDKTGLQFVVEDGRRSKAEELQEMVIQDIGISEEAREIFSLWLMSPLLEIQLKPHHCPFKITCQWDELLMKFTNATEEQVERDEPILMLRRQVFVPREREKYISDPEIVRLLYSEACTNIVEGRYPVEPRDYHRFAGMQACIQFGMYNQAVHTTKFYKDNVEDFYPDHVCKKSWSIPGMRHKRSTVEAWAHEHREISMAYTGERPEEKQAIRLMYLQDCQKLPYYGGAIFHGQVEKPSGALGKVTGSHDLHVNVAINRDGVFVIDKEKVTSLLGLLYKDLSWDYAEPEDATNRDRLPCLFLQFKGDEPADEKASLVLQVFSRQAVMMDALIEACVRAIMEQQQREAGSRDHVDGPASAAPLQEQIAAKLKSNTNTCMSNKLKRLCLSTVNAQGDRLK
ncbi:putative FERM domain-containing protein FRMD8P1 isoform X2 [Lineus longissimus]|uniref:putative FERM domain-containing protein FRMD8P1 isoform X2 n=1 Tax=Lineus longissimus TaxID=88925 RepID=UPI002B4D3F2E